MIKTLLENAAKAVQIEHRIRKVTPCFAGEPNFESECRSYHVGRRQDWVSWNPHTDDGDALRLAVTLRLPLEFRAPGFGFDHTPENNRVMCGSYWDNRESTHQMLGELVGSDPYAATRLAIVRAAAAIGESMLEAKLKEKNT